MEVMFDFVWKMYTRIPFVKRWMQERPEVWHFMGDWLERNREPPINYANQQNAVYRMNRSRAGKLNPGRFDKQKNQVLHYYRLTIFNNMKQNVDLDLSDQPDLDALCVQDYKFAPGIPVEILEDRFGLTFYQVQLQQDLDEIVSYRFQNE